MRNEDSAVGINKRNIVRNMGTLLESRSVVFIKERIIMTLSWGIRNLCNKEAQRQ